MRIHLFSDTHLDHGGETDLPRPDCDVVVVPGDVGGDVAKAMTWLRDHVARTGIPVLFVPGNHEFYGTSIESALRRGREASDDDVTLLDDATRIVGGARFVGATLWTDFDLDGTRRASMRFAAQEMNDHRLIQLRYEMDFKLFAPADALTLHRRQLARLDAELAKPFDGPTVVVTHHAPHPRSISSQWAGHRVNPSFASDLTSTIRRRSPALWLHGHVHSSHDYRVGETRVVANPRGYPRDGLCPWENPDFDPALVIEVPVP